MRKLRLKKPRKKNPPKKVKTAKLKWKITKRSKAIHTKFGKIEKILEAMLDANSVPSEKKMILLNCMIKTVKQEMNDFFINSLPAEKFLGREKVSQLRHALKNNAFAIKVYYGMLLTRYPNLKIEPWVI